MWHRELDGEGWGGSDAEREDVMTASAEELEWVGLSAGDHGGPDWQRKLGWLPGEVSGEKQRCTVSLASESAQLARCEERVP